MMLRVPENSNNLIVSAYAVYPYSSAEGIVNAALLDQLRKHIRVGLVTSAKGYQTQEQAATGFPVEIYNGKPFTSSQWLLTVVAKWLRLSKWHPLGATSRGVDRLRQNFLGLPSLQMAAWSYGAATQIMEWLNYKFQDGVVWARGTPPESFEAVLIAYKKKPFPLVVNYNDPMPHCLLWGERYGKINPALDELQHRQNAALSRYAQAWTFPSRRLAELMVAEAHLDPNRCFVIPHCVPGNHTALPKSSPSESLWIVYSGTFYSSVFTEEVKAGIAGYAQAGGRLKFMFLLKHPTLEVTEWIEKNLPGAVVYVDLHPSEVSQKITSAQVILIVDDAQHGVLLRTKLIEAVHSNKHILAFAPHQTTTCEVTLSVGGTVAVPKTASDVTAALQQVENNLTNISVKHLPEVRLSRERLSKERVVADALAVLSYAKNRFTWLVDGKGSEPFPPSIDPWP